MIALRQASLLSAEPGCVLLALALGWRCRVMLAAGGLGRFTLLPPEGWREPRSWALDPLGEFPVEGRSRDALSTPDASVHSEQDSAGITLTGDALQERIRLLP